MWGVVVEQGDEHWVEKFQDKEEAEQYFNTIQLSCGNTPVKRGVVSTRKAFRPPEGPGQKGGRYWCPYCVAYREFVHDDTHGVKRCNVCRISDRDFYVKKYNKLWD